MCVLELGRPTPQEAWIAYTKPTMQLQNHPRRGAVGQAICCRGCRLHLFAHGRVQGYHWLSLWTNHEEWHSDHELCVALTPWCAEQRTISLVLCCIRFPMAFQWSIERLPMESLHIRQCHRWSCGPKDAQLHHAVAGEIRRQFRWIATLNRWNRQLFININGFAWFFTFIMILQHFLGIQKSGNTNALWITVRGAVESDDWLWSTTSFRKVCLPMLIAAAYCVDSCDPHRLEHPFWTLASWGCKSPKMGWILG